MIIYPESKDPNEIKDYEFDWSPQLGTGEAVISQTVSFVDAAGTTPGIHTFTSTTSRVWLQAGTAGQRCIYTIRVATDGGRTLEEALAVDIVDSTSVTSDADSLSLSLVELKSARTQRALGKDVTEVWRDGRRIKYQIPSLAELNETIRQLEADLDAANIAAGNSVTPRRSAIGIYFR